MFKPFVHQKFLFNPRHEGARNDLSADGYVNVFVPAVGVLS